MTRWTARRHDAGSGPVTALLVMGMLALILAAGFTAVGAAAGDNGSSAQHAADAAALAGAQGVLDDMPDTLGVGFEQVGDITDVLGGGRCLQTGRVDATELASANGAALTSYCWNVFRDEVSVSVRMNTTNSSGTPATAKAEAATTFEASDCQLAGDFVAPAPEPTASVPGDPSAAPMPSAPLPRVPTSVDCGFGDLAVVFDPADLRFSFVGLAAALDELKPRLTA